MMGKMSTVNSDEIKKRKARIINVSHVTARKNEGSDSGPVLINRSLSITSANNPTKPFMSGWVDRAQR